MNVRGDIKYASCLWSAFGETAHENEDLCDIVPH